MPQYTASDELRFWSKVNRTDSCWEWIASRNSQGYGHFMLDGHIHLAHRVVWVMTHGEWPGELCVCHHCDNPSCVNPDHLFLGTRADNNRDRDLKGRYNAPGVQEMLRRMPHRRVRGERCHSAKLSESDVRVIRRRVLQGEPMRSIAREYGVGKTAISDIITRHTWAHVDED